MAVATPWIRVRAATGIDFHGVASSFKAPQPNCTQSSSVQFRTDRTGIEFAPGKRGTAKQISIIYTLFNDAISSLDYKASND
jgi:hypothetical protein